MVIYSQICVGIEVSNLHVEFYLVKILIRCWNFEIESWEFAAKYSHNWLKNAKKAKKFDLSLIQYPIWAKSRNPKPNRGQKNWPNPTRPYPFHSWETRAPKNSIKRNSTTTAGLFGLVHFEDYRHTSLLLSQKGPFTNLSQNFWSKTFFPSKKQPLLHLNTYCFLHGHSFFSKKSASK